MKAEWKVYLIAGRMGGYVCADCRMDLGYGFSLTLQHPLTVSSGVFGQKKSPSQCPHAGKRMRLPALNGEAL